MTDPGDSAVIQMNRFGYPVDLTDNFSEVIGQRTLPEAASCSDDGYSSGEETQPNLGVMEEGVGLKMERYNEPAAGIESTSFAFSC